MGNQKINGDDLLAIGYTQGPALGLALKINKKRNHYTRQEMLDHYKNILAEPKAYLEHSLFAPLASILIKIASQPENREIPLKKNTGSYAVYGAEQIEAGAVIQMETAMKLPVTVAGALMPDAHQGYGLPIGGVLAVKNAVIPYGVGVDIGCRMALSIYDIPESYFMKNRNFFREILNRHSRFGAGQGFQKNERSDHAVLESETFHINPFIQALQDKAWAQLGSSGGGNHFVEFGIIQFDRKDEQFNIEPGRYLALLSHSGSRGLGATIAGHYTRLAKDLCPLPGEAANLAFLDLNSDAGREYWMAMQLAGDYASACHEIIHHKISEAVGAHVLARVENHHNFAWKETWNGEELIVHRKGATPAGQNVLGFIPGSMTAPGFLVRGKGAENSINSASHGAGRQMSRTQAIKTLNKSQLRDALEQHDVTLIGAGMDEAPMAYKNIHTVMAAQKDLVDIIAEFQPKIVRMADDGSRED